MPTKNFKFQVNSLDDSGYFTGFASTFDNKDQQGDVVVKGAFTKTINDAQGKFPLLWQHNPENVVGLTRSAQETDSGFAVEGKLAIDTTQGGDTYRLMKLYQQEGAPMGMSIGYDTIKDSYDPKTKTRYLQQCNVHECSLTAFPANKQAVVMDVKDKAKTTDACNCSKITDFPNTEISMVEAELNEAETDQLKEQGGVKMADPKTEKEQEKAKDTDVTEIKALADSDKAKIESEVSNMSAQEAGAFHRRMHMWASRGSVLSGFSQADMDWLHHLVEQRLNKISEDGGGKPNAESPLEWPKGMRTVSDEDYRIANEDEKCVPGAVSAVISRAQAEKPKKPKAEKPAKDEAPEGEEEKAEDMEADVKEQPEEQTEKSVVASEEKAGAVFSKANLAVLKDVHGKLGTLIKQMGGDLQEPDAGVEQPPAKKPKKPQQVADDEAASMNWQQVMEKSEEPEETKDDFTEEDIAVLEGITALVTPAEPI